ncbi:TPA: hypothetical protein KNN84_002607 [Clostridioides difficile]|nr:hypothetical protein [Clostridioides difficile]
MNINTVQGDSIEVLLRQLGATRISKVSSTLYFIKFDLGDGWEISYTYNINAKDQYFLQRIEPYPIGRGLFNDEYEIVSFISKDLKKFLNAKNSSNFKTFVEVTRKVNSIIDNVEELFLNYNVDGNDLKTLNKELNDILNDIDYIEKHTKKI